MSIYSSIFSYNFTLCYILINFFIVMQHKLEINTLMKFDDINNKYDAEFVNVSLQEWLNLFTQNNHNTPLIKPSSVFKNYK